MAIADRATTAGNGSAEGARATMEGSTSASTPPGPSVRRFFACHKAFRWWERY